MSNTNSRFEVHIIVETSSAIAIDLLAEKTQLSKQHLKQVMQKGAVWHQRGKQLKRIRRAKKLIKKGEQLHLYFDETVLDKTVSKPQLIFDAGHYSVWHKPYGVLSQGSKWGDHCTITRYAEQHLSPTRTSFIVHRLDRAANGLIVIAHDKKAAAALSSLFQQRKINKRYQIWVHGEFDNKATEQAPITVNAEIDGRAAVSHFSFLAYDSIQHRSLLDVSIDTGRKHQIRRHSALLGYPVVGDRLHGKDTDQEDLQLCAYYLAFDCPFSHKPTSFRIKSYNEAKEKP